MTRHDIDLLLKKFYAGTSSPAEEQRLRRLLAADDCPAEFAADRFAVNAAVPDVEVPAGFDDRLRAAIAPAAPPAKAGRRHRHVVMWRIRWACAAVAAAFVIGIGVVGLHRDAPTVYANTCTTPEEAARATHDILFSLSKDMNRGLEAEKDLGGPCP